MAVYYVRSGATGAANGSTWADAFTTLAAGIAAAGIGDRVFVADDHAESLSTNTFFTLPGNTLSPAEIYCAVPGTEPPSALAEGASITQTANATITVAGMGHVRGLSLLGSPPTGVGGLLVYSTSNLAVTMSRCRFETRTTHTSARLTLGATANSTADTYEIRLDDCVFSFSAIGQLIQLNAGRVRAYGCSVDATGTAPLTLFALPRGCPVDAVFDNCDFSHTNQIVDYGNANGTGRVLFRNCLFPNAYTLAPGNPNGYGAPEIWADGCSTPSLQVPNMLHRVQSTGEVISDFTNYGVASDGTSPQSWKLTTNTRAVPVWGLYSPELATWNTVVGNPVTVSVECLVYGGLSLTNADLWLELDYPGVTDSVRYVRDVSSRVSSVLATPAACAAGMGVGEWTAPGTTPVSYKVSATVTPRQVGPLRARVGLSKASTTVYVDPRLVVST